MATFRYEHGHLGLQFTGDADHLVGGRHLEVELDLGKFAQLLHIRILDVAAILAQVHGDAIGTTEVGFHRGPCGIGLPGTARLAQGGHVVDVDAEFDQDGSPGKAKSSVKTRRDWSTCPPR